MLPTRVGVNRTLYALLNRLRNAPHTRGGEPVSTVVSQVVRYAPHTRGGEPSERLRSHRGRDDAPHTRGGEPELAGFSQAHS